MTQWKLELTEDTFHHTHPYFFSIEERIAGYENYYLTPRSSRRPLKTPSNLPPASAPLQPNQTAAPDDRKTETFFSSLLAFYTKSGGEYTFSRRGARHMVRSFPWQGHYHTHNYIEILCVLRGSFEQILLGERRKFFAGEFVITDQNLEHADYLSGERDACVLFLSLKSDYLDQLLSSYDRRDELQRFFFHALQRQRREQSYLHLRPSQKLSTAKSACAKRSFASSEPAGLSLELSRLLEALTAEDWSPGEGSPDIIRGNLIRLFSILCRSYSMQLHSSDRESKEKAFLYELERYIRIHAGQVTSLELEHIFHYHRNYFNFILQKYRGTTFQKYVRRIRLEHAAGLLASTRLPIREVALQSGWHNNSHFYHLFEACYGMSPSDYRRIHLL